MLRVALLCQVLAFRVMPCCIEVSRRDTMSLGDVLHLPGAPRDPSHVRTLSHQITAIKGPEGGPSLRRRSP
jgi:hypothetical protein